MFVLLKTTHLDEETTDCKVIACAKDKSILDPVKKKLDDEFSALDSIRLDYLNNDCYYATHPGAMNEYNINENIKEYNKKLVITHPKYLPYLTECGFIYFNFPLVEYEIQEVDELFS